MRICMTLFKHAEVYYYDDCAEAFEKGEKCSGVYTIKPDNLPPFEVSDEGYVLSMHYIH